MRNLLTKALLYFGSLALIPTSLEAIEWNSFLDKKGRFEAMMPSAPEHLQNKMNIDATQELHYDVFVSMLDQNTIFMVLVAEYPVAIAQEDKATSLEYFLNGMVGQGGKNQLVSADLLMVQGHQALDFHILTQGVDLRGRAIITNKSLYLIAMECESKNFSEETFSYFATSFKLTNPSAQ